MAVGLALGLPAAIGLSHWVRSQLFGVHFADPITLLLACASLAVAAGLAGYLPARRASPHRSAQGAALRLTRPVTQFYPFQNEYEK